MIAKRSVRALWDHLWAANGRRPDGTSREWVIAVLAAVLALDSADLTTLGAVATHVEPAFDIGHAELGLLATVTALVGALGTLPAGVLADRLRRTRLIGASIVLWSVAMVGTALAPTYEFMLGSRIALGAVTAAAMPALASLVGDYFAPGERARVYGYILSGELVGTGLGFVVSGLVAEYASWRLSFGWLALFGLSIAWLVGKRTPEPARDGSSRLSPSGARSAPVAQSSAANELTEIDGAKRIAAKRRISPDPELVLRRDARRMPFLRTALYVLRIRTNLILIVAGAVGYFFFAGLRTFGLIFARGQLGTGQSATIAVLFVAGLGSLLGVIASGRIADGLLERGRLNARIVVGAMALSLAPLFVAPGLFAGTIVLALPLWALIAAALAAPNPALDAARLDIVPAAIWGRAEAIRSAARSLLQAAAPLLFGTVAAWLGGAGIPSDSRGHISASVVTGLRGAFLLMLIPLFASGAIVWLARRTYRRDVATAMASDESSAQPREACAAASALRQYAFAKIAITRAGPPVITQRASAGSSSSNGMTRTLTPSSPIVSMVSASSLHGALMKPPESVSSPEKNSRNSSTVVMSSRVRSRRRALACS